MTTTTVTLASFLLARLDEDESGIPPLGDDPFLPHGQHWSEVPFAMASAQRALLEVAAKRTIVESALEWDGDPNEYGQFDIVLRALASVYADHSDYREEWR